MCRHGLACVLALLLGGRTLLAAPEPPAPHEPPAPDEAAVEVVKAVEARQEGALRKLAARDLPDPWLVADAVLLQGAKGAAEAFAKAAPRKDVEKLPEFVATWTAGEADVAARTAMAEGNAALTERRPDDARRSFEVKADGAMAFLRARLAFGRALALRGLGQGREAADQFESVAGDLEALGWLARASESLRHAVEQRSLLEDPTPAFATVERLVALDTTRGDVPSVIRLRLGTSHLQGRLGRWEDAATSAQQAVDLAKGKDRPLLAAAWNALGWADVHRSRAKEAHDGAERSQSISELMGLVGETTRSHEIHAMAYVLEGKYGLSENSYRAAVELARKADDPALLGRMLTLWGFALGDLGEPAKALEPLKEALTVLETLDPSSGASVTLTRARYAWSLALAAKPAEARPLAEKAVADAARLSKNVQAMAEWALGTILQLEGKPEEAVAALTRAGAAYERAREFDSSFRLVAGIAEVRRAQGNVAEARRAADAALDGARRVTKALSLPIALTANARVLLAEGKAREALVAAKEAEAAFRGLGILRGYDAARELQREIEAALPK